MSGPQYLTDPHHSTWRPPLGSVWIPLLYFLYTCDYTATFDSNVTEQSAEDTAVAGLIRNNDEQAYQGDVKKQLVLCQDKSLLLSVNKTKELIVDFRRGSTTTSVLMVL